MYPHHTLDCLESKAMNFLVMTARSLLIVGRLMVHLLRKTCCRVTRFDEFSRGDDSIWRFN